MVCGGSISRGQRWWVPLGETCALQNRTWYLSVYIYMHLRIRFWTGRLATATCYAADLSRGGLTFESSRATSLQRHESAKNSERMIRLMFSDWITPSRPRTCHVTKAGKSSMHSSTEAAIRPPIQPNNTHKLVFTAISCKKQQKALSFNTPQSVNLKEDQRSPLFSQQKPPVKESLILSWNQWRKLAQS